MLLLVVLDALDNVGVALDFSLGGEEGGSAVLLDDKVVVTEALVEQGEGISIFTAIDSVVFGGAVAATGAGIRRGSGA